LAVRAAWLKALPERRDALIVDSGDILAGTGDPVRSREILEVCAELGYDAIAIGGREIADGIEVLPDYRDRFKLFCQNLAICSSQHCLFLTPEPFLIEKAGEKIGLIALLNPHALAAYPKQATQDAKLVPPDLLAGSLVDQLDGQGAEWVILLYHGPVKEAEMLARKVHGIHLIVIAGEPKLLPPRKVGGTLLVSPGEGGNRVGILELNRDGHGRIRYSHRFQVFRDGIDPADPEVLKRIERLR
jgi:2',3'-cyclic-nucleotide 2'-phosphodiesterase (5'-nucleotidase family)